MLKNLNKRKKKKGFTLIELVIVLAVLAIIALIAIPNFTKVRNDSMFKSDQRSAEQIQKITLMAIADEKITTSGNYLLAFTSGTKKLATVTPQGGTALGATHDYVTMLNEVKMPQMGTNNGYTVTVNSDMSVSVAYTTGVTIDGSSVTTLTK